jgi:hypothetical protein
VAGLQPPTCNSTPPADDPALGSPRKTTSFGYATGNGAFDAAGANYMFLVTIISLSSEIAWEGFSPLGHALAQFMIVWHR